MSNNSHTYLYRKVSTGFLVVILIPTGYWCRKHNRLHHDNSCKSRLHVFLPFGHLYSPHDRRLHTWKSTCTQLPGYRQSNVSHERTRSVDLKRPYAHNNITSRSIWHHASCGLSPVLSLLMQLHQVLIAPAPLRASLYSLRTVREKGQSKL